MSTPSSPHQTWWKKAQFYQIWPKSFCDSNGDGIGDLKGIVSKLEHLRGLGVDAIWITPFYPSPQKDNGYDIMNYRDIDPSMGTLEDFDELVEKAHQKGIKVIIDLVVNHCSDQHEWFQKSRAGDPKYKDYFIWKKGKGEDQSKPPNNWGSIFSGSAWTFDKVRNEYYFHMFAPDQPDLNWENPEVQQEVVEIIRFWNKRKIDGFRLDATCHISKPEGMPDYDTEEPFFRGDMHVNGPKMHEYLKIICSAIRENEGSVIFGELGSVPLDEIDLSIAPSRREMDLAILFEHTGIDIKYHPVKGKFNYKGVDLKKLKRSINKWYDNIKEGWINLHLCNHDQSRIVSRWGAEGIHWETSAKMLGMLYHFMRGTPFIYQGEEIGMTSWKFSKEEADDVEFHRFYHQLVDQLKVSTHDEFMHAAHLVGRDTARTPVQWNSEENAGFTSGKPWLPVNSDFKKVNAESQEKDPKSVLSFYKKIVKTRKENDMLIDGELEQIFEDKETLFGYKRFLKDSDEVFYAFFNFSSLFIEIKDSDEFNHKGNYEVVLSNIEGYKFDPSKIEVKPWMGVLLKSTKPEDHIIKPKKEKTKEEKTKEEKAEKEDEKEEVAELEELKKEEAEIAEAK